LSLFIAILYFKLLTLIEFFIDFAWAFEWGDGWGPLKEGIINKIMLFTDEIYHISLIRTCGLYWFQLSKISRLYSRVGSLKGNFY